jgi:hypothetical protein
MPLCRTSILGEAKSFSFMDTPADSIGVLWAYMIIYVIINLGAWSMLLWPIYRPLSLFVQRDRENRQLGKTQSLEHNAQGRVLGGAHRAAPQY